MPVKFRPARATGLARGLSVVEGEPRAAARRAAALRRSAQTETTPAVGEEARYQRMLERTAEQGTEDEGLARVRENLTRSRTGYGPLPEATPFTVIDAATGEGRRVVRRPPPRYSPEATAAQAMRAEAMARHAGAVEDPRAWFGEPGNYLTALREKADSFGWSKRAADTWYRRMAADYEATKAPPPSMTPAPSRLLDAFEREYGWRPENEEHARRMLSPQALEDLGFPPET